MLRALAGDRAPQGCDPSIASDRRRTSAPGATQPEPGTNRSKAEQLDKIRRSAFCFSRENLQPGTKSSCLRHMGRSHQAT